MKRVRTISDLTAAETLLRRLSRHAAAEPRAVAPSSLALAKAPSHRFARDLSSLSSHADWCPDVLRLFSETPSHQSPGARAALARDVAELSGELARNAGDSEKVARVLEKKGDSLLLTCLDGWPIVELLKKLDSLPRLALEVFNWRRKNVACAVPITAEEYVNGIALAGKLKSVTLAFELFVEASNKNIKTTATYNALMSVCLSNDSADKCHSLFMDMKREANCSPSIVTYNILILAFGRLMLFDDMETVFREIKGSNLSPNLTTYNNLISGYLTAWMWDRMENTFHQMKVGHVKPDTATHLLMLRGYLNSGNLEKMEEMYELIKDYVNEKEIPLIRAMICAHCKTSGSERLKKIEALMRHIPEKDYRLWLNILLIRVYAEENQLEAMENSINELFKHKTCVQSLDLMRSISSAYFRRKAVNKLANFVKRAESAGWRICRSLYHCKMVMHGSEKLLDKMESVLYEMKSLNLEPNQKTFWILYKAYLTCGRRHKAAQVIGLMYKLGYEIPSTVLPS